MYVKLVLALLVFCAVLMKANSEKSYYGSRPHSQQGYTKIKRGKYYSSTPQRYITPPVSFHNRGSFSYNPLPKYMMGDYETQYPRNLGKSRPPKVSKRPNNDIGDEDVHDIVKYLSNQDLDKVLEFGGDNDRNDKYSKEFEKYIEYRQPIKEDFKNIYSFLDDVTEKYLKPLRDEDIIFKAHVQQFENDSKYNAPYQEPKRFPMEYSNRYPSINYATEPTPAMNFYIAPQNNQLYTYSALDTQESMLKSQIAYLNSLQNDGVLYTDSQIMPEETLPKPMNLREDQDFDASYTNNVPTVLKADQSSLYKLENFGDLPLMNYNSKLDTVSSYHVPHYTVTSSKQSSSYAAPPSTSFSVPAPYSGTNSKVPVEAAPPPSAAKTQSDAHLKAIRIWSHKSQGTAYTLHDDGTLSLEKSKESYGVPLY